MVHNDKADGNANVVICFVDPGTRYAGLMASCLMYDKDQTDRGTGSNERSAKGKQKQTASNVPRVAQSLSMLLLNRGVRTVGIGWWS